ncbi:MAG: 3-hydroxyisobutyrate dehydrogenase [Micrococcaceae bacterium]
MTEARSPETSSAAKTHVAFIGLGHMGGPMAANLVAAGVTVTGYDVVPSALDAARTKGVTIAADIPGAVREADVVLTMLPSGAHVHEVYRGTEATGSGALDAAPPGALFLDCSTIDVAEAQHAAEMVVQAGFTAADAPVSGGVVGAEAGTLAFMVGGTEETFAAVHPLLEIMGARIVHCGGAGMGQAAKVCNNMLLGVTMIGAAEAFVLGERLGLDHQALFDVISQASGQCWAVTTNCPVPGPVPGSPANRDYQPGFATALMNKDLGLAVQALESTGSAAPMGELAHQIYRDFAATDGAHRDFSAIINELRENQR